MKSVLTILFVIISSTLVAQNLDSLKVIDEPYKFAGEYKHLKIGTVSITRTSLNDQTTQLQIVVDVKGSILLNKGIIHCVDCYFNTDNELIASVIAYNGVISKLKRIGYFKNGKFILQIDDEEESAEYPFVRVKDYSAEYYF